MTEIVEIRHMSKRFGPTVALDDVDISAYPGEVLGLIGENVSSSSQQIISALLMVGFLIYLNNEGKLKALFRR